MEVPAPAVEFNEVYRNFVGSAGYFVANNIYSRLVVFDTGSPAAYPDLAEHWEMAPDARTLRFQLNRHARWHDGEPVTAEDVAYTHLTALAHGYHAASFLHDVQDIEVLGPHELRYVLRRPNAGFLAQLGNLVFAHILPKHLYEGTDWATNPYNQQPVGSGPFRFVEHVPGERVVLEAWDGYWGPRPQIDRVILDIEPDLDEAVRKVADGRAHYMVQDVLTFPRLHLAEGAQPPRCGASAAPASPCSASTTPRTGGATSGPGPRSRTPWIAAGWPRSPIPAGPSRTPTTCHAPWTGRSPRTPPRRPTIRRKRSGCSTLPASPQPATSRHCGWRT